MFDDLVDRLRNLSHFEIRNAESVTHVSAESVTELREIAQEAADTIEELSKPRWIPVEERLPKYRERVLVFGGVTMYVAYYDKNRYGGESWHKLNSKSHYCNPTHWMPLPQPPKEETK